MPTIGISAFAFHLQAAIFWPREATWLIAAAWLVMFFGAIGWMAFLFLRGWEEEKRRREGRCIYCGYDLRASRHRCPECGRPILEDPPSKPLN